MNHIASQFVALFAATSPVEGDVREYVAYELGRLAQFDDPRMLWLTVGIALALVTLFVIWLYVREKENLSILPLCLLTSLRLIAFVGAIVFFLSPEKRFDRQIVTDSQVIILVDSSQSMSVEDEPSAENADVARADVVANALRNSSLVENLREQHDVSLSSFDSQLKRLASWKRRRDPIVVPMAAEPPSLAEPPEDAGENVETPSDWIEQLQPQGTETRLGDALKSAFEDYEGGPLAGVIVISDGGQNTGIDPVSIFERNQGSKIPVFTVGVGSPDPRKNLRIQEFNAPSRVFPNDVVLVRALVQGEGFTGRSVEVELTATEPDGAVSGRVGLQRITFDDDRQVIPLQFEIEPTEIGRLLLGLRILVPDDDQYAGDDSREVEVDVVETQTRVLLIASGATRDYRFLRNQLRRDNQAAVDVWLQEALPGISQDADKILDAFPSTKKELFAYDCIVGFDPNWDLLDVGQAQMLETWVAEEAGGLIVVAGPIHTAAWVQNPELGKIRALYPVVFQRRLTLLDDGVYGSKIPWPIDFSREGEDSDFLWLADTAAESQSVWSRFTGVFGCYAVKGSKPGARVLGRYSDPEVRLSVGRPVYFAEHFYGGGRVFYMGSGELWRLRRLGVRYFEQLYTQLIRHVSQGRLLRGSSRGRLLVQRDRYFVGDEVVVRGQLLTASREPVIADRVTARVVGPQGEGRNLTMNADQNRPGNFIGQFNVRREGAYRIELPIPDVLDEQLVRRIQVTVPNLEFDRTRRNEKLLAALASQSAGVYYTSLRSAIEGTNNIQPVAQQIESRSEVKTLRGTPDREFAERLNRILLAVICGALCLEWLLRRLMKLA